MSLLKKYLPLAITTATLASTAQAGGGNAIPQTSLSRSSSISQISQSVSQSQNLAAPLIPVEDRSKEEKEPEAYQPNRGPKKVIQVGETLDLPDANAQKHASGSSSSSSKWMSQIATKVKSAVQSINQRIHEAYKEKASPEEIAELLKEKGADINAEVGEKTLLRRALLDGNQKMVEFLSAQPSIDLTSLGSSPLPTTITLDNHTIALDFYGTPDKFPASVRLAAAIHNRRPFIAEPLIHAWISQDKTFKFGRDKSQLLSMISSKDLLTALLDPTWDTKLFDEALGIGSYLNENNSKNLTSYVLERIKKLDAQSSIDAWGMKYTNTSVETPGGNVSFSLGSRSRVLDIVQKHGDSVQYDHALDMVLEKLKNKDKITAFSEFRDFVIRYGTNAVRLKKILDVFPSYFLSAYSNQDYKFYLTNPDTLKPDQVSFIKKYAIDRFLKEAESKRETLIAAGTHKETHKEKKVERRDRIYNSFNYKSSPLFFIAFHENNKENDDDALKKALDLLSVESIERHFSHVDHVQFSATAIPGYLRERKAREAEEQKTQKQQAKIELENQRLKKAEELAIQQYQAKVAKLSSLPHVTKEERARSVADILRTGSLQEFKKAMQSVPDSELNEVRKFPDGTQTFLTLTTTLGKLEQVEYLLTERKAIDPNQANDPYTGETPLEIAARMGREHEKIVFLLLKHELTELLATNAKGEKPLDIAKKSGNSRKATNALIVATEKAETDRKSKGFLDARSIQSEEDEKSSQPGASVTQSARRKTCFST